MSEQPMQHLVEKLRDRAEPFRLYLTCTGAGAGLQARIWDVPGCSSFLVGGHFPYAQEETTSFLGFQPTSFCSRETAIDLAMESYRRAFDPKSKAEPVGFGLTASVASLKEHRGEHRIHAAVMTRGGIFTTHVGLPKGVGLDARKADGDTADRVGLSLIMRALGFPSELVAPYDNLESAEHSARTQFLDRGYHLPNGQRRSRLHLAYQPVAFLPTSANPPHEGHFGAASAVAQMLRQEVIFSVTANPPHKAPLALHEMLERSKLLHGHHVLFSEGDALYIEKARRYPTSSFVVGTDTVRRMLDPKWCPVAPMIEEFRSFGTKFYVIGRWDKQEERFVTLADIPEAAPYKDLFVQVEGRWDISSTELRERAALA